MGISEVRAEVEAACPFCEEQMVQVSQTGNITIFDCIGCETHFGTIKVKVELRWEEPVVWFKRNRPDYLNSEWGRLVEWRRWVRVITDGGEELSFDRGGKSAEQRYCVRNDWMPRGSLPSEVMRQAEEFERREQQEYRREYWLRAKAMGRRYYDPMEILCQ